MTCLDRWCSPWCDQQISDFTYKSVVMLELLFSLTTEPPYFVEYLEPMEVTAGDAVCLKCKVAGTPEIKVSWFKADGKVRSSPNCKLEYSKGVACLKLSKATKADIGEYSCKAENKIGATSSACRLSVLGEHLFPILCGNVFTSMSHTRQSLYIHVLKFKFEALVPFSLTCKSYLDSSTLCCALNICVCTIHCHVFTFSRGQNTTILP